MLTQEESWLLREKYHGEKTAGFFADCKRLNGGEPLAYVIGYVTFLNCQIWLDSRPLIPRAETEFWVEYLIKQIKKTDINPAVKILDLCAGSGCIGAAIAKALPLSYIDFIELDPAHINTIKKNCQANNLAQEQTKTMSGNLLENLNPAVFYDFIISNPPYIDPSLDRTEISVKNFEPHLALYGGVDGLQIIDKIIKNAPHHLNHKGELWLEHEPEQVPAIRTLGDNSFTITTLKDQYQVERFSRLVLK